MEHALFVESLMATGGFTWRTVADEVHRRFPGELLEDDLDGNQGAGMILCDVAAGVLGRPVGFPAGDHP
jgi:hypothetical protein